MHNSAFILYCIAVAIYRYIDILLHPYNQGEQQAYVEHNLPMLTWRSVKGLRLLFSMIDGNIGSMLFLDAPGGTGKTFLINLICDLKVT